MHGSVPGQPPVGCREETTAWTKGESFAQGAVIINGFMCHSRIHMRAFSDNAQYFIRGLPSCLPISNPSNPQTLKEICVTK